MPSGSPLRVWPFFPFHLSISSMSELPAVLVCCPCPQTHRGAAPLEVAWDGKLEGKRSGHDSPRCKHDGKTNRACPYRFWLLGLGQKSTWGLVSTRLDKGALPNSQRRPSQCRRPRNLGALGRFHPWFRRFSRRGPKVPRFDFWMPGLSVGGIFRCRLVC